MTKLDHSEHSIYDSAINRHITELIVLLSATNRFCYSSVVSCIITRLLHATGHDCGQFCHFELRKWCDALLILRQASSAYYLHSESCPACCPPSNNLLPRRSACKMHIPLNLQLEFMGYITENFRMSIWKLHEMYVFVLNTDVAMIPSCKCHSQRSCNAES